MLQMMCFFCEWGRRIGPKVHRTPNPVPIRDAAQIQGFRLPLSDSERGPGGEVDLPAVERFWVEGHSIGCGHGRKLLRPYGSRADWVSSHFPRQMDRKAGGEGHYSGKS